jgi:hypothetical protein
MTYGELTGLYIMFIRQKTEYIKQKKMINYRKIIIGSKIVASVVSGRGIYSDGQHFVNTPVDGFPDAAWKH